MKYRQSKSMKIYIIIGLRYCNMVCDEHEMDRRKNESIGL